MWLLIIPCDIKYIFELGLFNTHYVFHQTHFHVLHLVFLPLISLHLILLQFRTSLHVRVIVTLQQWKQSTAEDLK